MSSENKESNVISAIQYFASKAAADSTRFDVSSMMQRGERLLQAQAKLFLSEDAETKQCAEFIAWADGSSIKKKNGNVQKNMKCVVTPVTVEVLGLPSNKVQQAELLEFAPRGGIDDIIYSKNRDIWQKLPRGCCMLRITFTSGLQQMLWAVRANRKFTGHEDESSDDAAKYTIVRDNGGNEDEKADAAAAEATNPDISTVVVSLKENGQVVHVAARSIQIENQSYWVLFIGSKHVHLAIGWQPHTTDFNLTQFSSSPQTETSLSSEQFLKRVNSFPAERFSLAQSMSQVMWPHLSDQLVLFLAKYRLVLNSEYVTPSGSGPINNQLVHGIGQGTPFAFSLVFNVLHPVAGVELCLEPMYAYHLMNWFRLKMVHHFLASSDEVPQIRKEIAALPLIEGAVVYYLDSLGVIRLEKAKTTNYVIVRSIREKIKPFLRGRKDEPGFVPLWTDLMGHFDRLHVSQLPDQTWELSVNEHKDSKADCNVPALKYIATAALTDSIVKCGAQMPPGDASRGKKRWCVDRLPDTRALKRGYQEQVLEWVRKQRAAKTAKAIENRIREIDHVPVSDEERNRWIAAGHAFVEWLLSELALRNMTAEHVVESFSTCWSTFYEQLPPNAK